MTDPVPLTPLVPVPLLLLAAAVAGALLVAAGLRPAWALLLLVGVVVSNASSVLGPVGPLSAFLVAFATAAGALVLGLRRGTVRPAWSPLYLMALVYVAARLVSLPAAEDLPAGLEALAREVTVLLLLPVLTPLVTAHLRPAVAVAVGVGTVLAALTLVQEFALGNATDFYGFSKVPVGQDVGATTVRHSGPEDDVNFWSRHLVLLLPMALALADRRRAPRAVGWLGAAAVLAGGQYLTQSRGGMLAFVAAGLVWLLLSGLSARRFLALSTGALVALLLVPGVASRLATLTMTQPGPPSQSDRSLVDRVAVQRAGLAMFVDNPVVGVGPGNFEERLPEYRRQYAPELSEVIASHNLYVQMLAEGGVVGFLGWLALYGGALFLALRAWLVTRLLRAPPDARQEGRLAAGVMAGLVGWGIASVFLHLGSPALVVVMFSVAAALDLRARAVLRTLPARVTSAPGLTSRLPTRVAPAALLSGLALLLLGQGTALTGGLAPTTWTVSARTTVSPVAHAEDDPYVRDVLARGTVVLSYAALAREPSLVQAALRDAGRSAAALSHTSVTTAQPVATDLVEVTVVSRDQETAQELAPAVLAALRTRVADLDGLYVVDDVVLSSEPQSWDPGSSRLPLLVAVAGLLCVATALLLRTRVLGREGST